jgi:hypothetical protein
MIKPFNRLQPPPTHGNFVSVKYFRRAIKAMFGGWNITMEGGDLQQTGDGHLHIRVTPSSSTDIFAVSAVAGGFRIAPGKYYSTSSGWQTPVIGGTPLTATTPPTLTWTGTSNVFIYLKVKFDMYGQAIEGPWAIEASATAPTDTPVRRANGLSTAPQAGIYHVLIASREGGTLRQWVRHNIIANLQWENFFCWG